MKYIVMNLCSDQMAFGYDNNTKNRYTNDFPTKSAIFGMICCGMGKNGILQDLFGRLLKVEMEVFSMHESRIETDFQTIGTGWLDSGIQWTNKRSGTSFNLGEHMVERTIEYLVKYEINSKTKSSTCTELLKKDYLVAQHFAVLLKVADDEFAREIAEALQHPVWPIYFGRKKCIPVEELFLGMFDDEATAMEVIDAMKPLYRYTERMSADYLDEYHLRDVPTTEFNRYDTYASRRVYKCEYVA